MHQIQLGGIDYAILITYFVFVIGIGFALRRFVKSSEDFFLSGRSIPTWIAGLAFLSANLGAQEVIGMAASGAAPEGGINPDRRVAHVTGRAWSDRYARTPEDDRAGGREGEEAAGRVGPQPGEDDRTNEPIARPSGPSS